jgi:hypothetical protein
LIGSRTSARSRIHDEAGDHWIDALDLHTRRLHGLEKSIEYVLTERPLNAPEIFEIHPLGKMPVLRHGDFVLFESKAIATYLDRSFAGPQLIPSEPRLAGLTEQWVSFVNTIVDRTLIRTYLFAYLKAMMTGEPPDRVAIDAVLPAVRRSAFSTMQSPKQDILSKISLPWPISTFFRSSIALSWRRKGQKLSLLRTT